MPAINPFRGWFYNQSKLPDLSQVITPPYDNISPIDQSKFYAASDHNFVRLILNNAQGDSRYSAAAETLATWQANQILIHDNQPAIYLLTQSFRKSSRLVTRTGIIAALKLEELGSGILPHEQTFPKHIKDRYQLMETTHANLGQIFMCYRDRDNVVESIARAIMIDIPFIDFELDDIRFRLWRITDHGLIDLIQKNVAQGPAIIADGHHRYKTALEFHREHTVMPGADQVMVTLVNSYDSGLEILPIHRLVSGIEISAVDLLTQLEKQFRISAHKSLADLLKAVYEPARPAVNRLGLHDCRSSANLLLECRPAQTTPDATILDQTILKDIVGIDTDQQGSSGQVTYRRGAGILEHIAGNIKNYDLIGFLRPPSVEQVFSSAEQGRIMPPKTTFFFPKAYSGLITRQFG